jgi:hypothetical protein
MDKPTFIKLNELVESNLEKKHVQEIFEIIKNADCLFFPGIIMPQDHIASLYKLRLKIAKESNKLQNDYIDDFERTVSNLQDSKSKDSGITWLIAENSGYLIFYEPVEKNILGVLKIGRPSTLQSIENTNQMVNQEYSSGFLKYSKGELVKEWK